jgi:2-methylcitrate dehydratase PrpD
MAKKGLTTDGEIFDGKRGVLDTYQGGDGEPIEAVMETLGKPWEILKPGNYVKRWPCCYSGHRTLGALYGMIDKHGLTPGNVEEVSVSFLPGGDTALFSRDPQTGLEAKFSIEYMVAAALLDGPLRMATFADDKVARPEARALMKRVRRIPIPDAKSYSGIAGYNDIAVTTPSGRHEVREDRVPGSFAWPPTEAELDEKFLDCATAVLGAAGARQLLDRAKICRNAVDLRAITGATVAPN